MVRPNLLIEVKRGATSPLEFAWFARTFPQAQLRVVGRDRFSADRLTGTTLEDLLLDPDW